LIQVALPLALTVYLCACLLLPPLRSIAGIESRRTASTVRLDETLVRGAWIVVSLSVGVLTHLVWDGLTELGGSRSALLQHGSTALGLLVLAVVAHRRRKVVQWHDATVRRNLMATFTMCALGALGGALVANKSWLNPPSELSTSEIVEGVLASGAVGAGVGVVVTAVALAFVWWITKGLRSETSEQ
jgi:hypothetical protein